jgi:signal transduction histidine kinase
MTTTAPNRPAQYPGNTWPAKGARPARASTWAVLSLRARLTVTTLVLALVLVALSSGTSWFLMRRLARHQVEAAVGSVCALLAHGVTAGLDFDSRASVRDALTGVFRLEEVRYAAVTAPDGSLYMSLGDPFGSDPGNRIPEDLELNWSKKLLVGHAPIRDASSRVIGVLHLGYSTARMQGELQQGLLLLLLAGAGLALTALFASRNFGRKLSAPILELADAARKMAEGKFEKPLEIRTQDEVGIVAMTFNGMARKLEESRVEIERQNRELEQKVRERTAELRLKNVALAQQSEKALEASRLKSAFLANMSHELRTPLNAILALSELLSDEVTGPLENDEQRNQIQMIHQSGENLLRLISDVLDLSKIEAGRMEIHYEETDIQKSVLQAAEQMRGLAANKGIEYRIRLEGEGTGWADADRIRQVMANLVANAVKFTERGFVEITSQLDLGGEQLSIAVRDSGIGIAADNHERIFQEFRQVDGSASRRFGGTGLGLAISRRLARLMGGDVSIASEAGKGSVFTLTVPVYRQKPGPEVTVDLEADSLPPSPQSVDDDGELRAA